MVDGYYGLDVSAVYSNAAQMTVVETKHMDLLIKSEWLAELLVNQTNLITEYWIEDIRAEDIPHYLTITDEQLCADLPPTVDSMIYAFRTGDTEGPRKHSIGVIQRRLAGGFQLPELQRSLHALQTAVMRIVKESDVGPVKELEALDVTSNMYYIVALIAAAVYEQIRIEQQRQFTTAYEFGLSLSRNLNLESILDTAVRQIAEYINADSVAILLAKSQGNRDELRAYYNLDAKLAEAMPRISESLGCGMVDTDSPNMRESACVVSDVCDYSLLDRWSALLLADGRRSMVCAPLLAKQKYLGSLVVMWSDIHTVSDTEKDFLLAMAGHIANAVQNALLFEEAQGKRELGVLLNASRLFASSLDTQDILHKIAKMATDAVRADLAVVFTQNHLQKSAHHIAYYVSRKIATNAVRRIIGAVVPKGEEDGFSSLGQDFADGKPLMFGSPAELPEQLQSLVGNIGSGMILPLRLKDVLVAAFAIIALEENAFTENDLILAIGLADLAAVAIENARLYEYERNIAETLQRSFLPSSLPSIDGYEIAAYYKPAMAEAAIGGDFYDVFENGKGNISVIIGDVSGKGLKAAIPTAMGKYMVRAYAAENPSPGDVMARFNRTFSENMQEGPFMTAFYGSLNPRDNVFTYVSAGHEPPLLYSSTSGRVEQIHTAGVCLGIMPEAEYEENKILLQPGDVLLLYTDGATDVKVNSNRLEVEGLQQLLLSNAQGSAEQIVRNISDAIWDLSHGRLPDDVTLVALKRL